MSHDVWKFRDNPAGPGIVVVAVDAGRIVGQYALLPTRLRLGDEVVLGAESVDTMIHPDYRNQGMFVTLAKACLELAAKKGVEALYGFPNTSSYPGFIRRLNWDHTGDIPIWKRIFSSAALTSFPRVVKPVAALGLHLLPWGNISRNMDIRPGIPCEDDLNSLLVDWRASEDLCRVDRSIEWYRWRFHPNSQHSYEWVTVYHNREVQALAIWGVREPWGGVLMDLLGSNSEALEAATSSAIRRAKKSGVSGLTAVTNCQQAIQVLKSCGFIRAGSFPLIMRSMTPRTLGGNIHNHASWQIFSADLDIF
jgi:N-acetylglutamate synthase-like GNAT family acetyltransferase